MRNFRLKTNSGETINSFYCQSYEQAVDYFSKVKRLSKKILLRIFIVTE